jgi:glycosyltransferase involved in cell wall biosynthesis
MVKNESRILRRMMESIVEKVDAIVVADTGSTDDTVAIGKAFLEEKKKPGTVAQTSWVNFGVSRTESFSVARNWLMTEQPSWDPAKTWALLIDGDMVLEGAISRKRLAELSPAVDGVMLNQKQASLIFKNARLIRMNREVECIGATHEYWAIHNRVFFEEPYINDIGDGGAKADKFPRDARLLEAELEKTPKHDRTLFYLGQTYKCLHRWEDAIKMLERRVEVGGWDEEVYMALVYIGECYAELKNEAGTVEAWLRAWERCPGRTEAAMNLVEHYRKKPSMQFVATMFLEKLLACQGHPIPVATVAKQDYSLFVNHRRATQDMWMELAILSYYTDHKKDAFEAIDRLVLKKSLDWNFRNTLLGYQKWYDVPLQTVRFVRVRIPEELKPWRDETDASIWETHNPSIRRGSNGRYEATLRCANYYTTDGKTWPQRGRGPNIITRTVLCELDGDLKVCETPIPVELRIPAEAIVKTDTIVQGIEDVRMMAGTNKRILSGNSPQITHYDKPQVCFMGYDMSGNVSLEVRETPFGAKGVCQKNWLLFEHHGKPSYVYSIHPFLAYTFDNVLLKMWQSSGDVSLDNLRGGAAPIFWHSREHAEEIYIMVVHFCHYNDGGRRYWSRFITLTDDLTPVRMSKMFRFTKNDIEYVSTMCEANSGNYLLGMGVNESECWVAEVTPQTIDDILTIKLG